MNRLATIVAVSTLTLALGACYTPCSNRSYFKPTVLKSVPDISVNRRGTRIDLEVADKVYVELFECGLAYRDATGGPASMCLTLIPKQGTNIRLEKDRVFFGAANAQPGIARIKKLSYSIFCTKKDTDYDCSSMPEKIEGAEIGRRESVYRQTKTIFINVDLLAQLPGVRDSQHSYIVPGRDRLRRYSGDLRFPKTSEQAVVVVELPGLAVDGHTYQLPRVTFNHVTEEVCVGRSW